MTKLGSFCCKTYFLLYKTRKKLLSFVNLQFILFQLLTAVQSTFQEYRIQYYMEITIFRRNLC